MTPEERYTKLASEMAKFRGVTVGAEGKKGFGSSALQFNKKIFAMLGRTGRLVVKLPSERVDALIAEGKGERFDPGHGRLMKEWLSVAPAADSQWRELANEAWEFARRNR